MRLRQDLKTIHRKYQYELAENKRLQQLTVLEIRRLKKARRKINAICDANGIKLEKKYHNERLKSIDAKYQISYHEFWQNIRSWLRVIETRLKTSIESFQHISAESRKLKQNLANVDRISGNLP